MILDVINAAKNIIKDNHTINHEAVTRFNFFVPEDYAALCCEPDTDSEDEQSMNMHSADHAFKTNLYYVEKAGINRDMTGFVNKVENIVDTLRDAGNLNGTVMYFNSTIKYLDMTRNDNIEFIARITLTGRVSS